MKKVLALLFLVSLSCAHVATGMDESKQSYYKWRINKTYNQIFWGTDVWQLEYLVFSDKGEELKAKVRREGIDITEKGLEGISLLGWTVGAGLLNASKALLELGADPDYLNDLDISVLGVAILARNAKMVEVLLPFMENIYFSTNQKGERVEVYTNEVIIYDDIETLKVFLDNGYDPDWVDRGGGNPLINAVSGAEDINHRMALMLLDKGARPDTTPRERDWFLDFLSRRPFGYNEPLPFINYDTDEYGEIYQRMIEFGVAEPNEAHNEWLVSQDREPNP
jgi:hypothetical protein